MSNAKKFRIICLIISMIMVLSVIFMELMDNTAYEADATALEAMESSETVEVVDKTDHIAFIPEDMGDIGIIFYPGGNVKAEAYAPLMHEIAKQGYLCAIVRVPLNLAVLDADAADCVYEEYKSIADWYVAGHSLGGAMGATYALENAKKLNGLILLASYSTEDLTDSKLEVLSIYGSSDEVLNRRNYEKYQSNLPKDAVEVVISGGNHAYFGNYGEQRGDGSPQCPAEEQQELTVEAICELLEN